MCDTPDKYSLAIELEMTAFSGLLGDAVEVDPVARDHAIALLTRLAELQQDEAFLEECAK